VGGMFLFSSAIVYLLISHRKKNEPDNSNV